MKGHAPSSFLQTLFWAAAVRVALLVYGAWQDKYLEVRYTDIDFDVFSDGAELVWRGRSPFERPTYRYTPLLALVLTPNVWAHPAWGKLLFAAADLAVGAQIHAILLARRVPQAVARGCAGVWLFNPLSINVSTRGNSESLVLVLLLGSVHALLCHRAAAAGALLAAAMHMKPYPIIYVLAFLASLDGDYAAATGVSAASSSTVMLPSLTSTVDRRRASLVARAVFSGALAAVYMALFGACWAWCGEPFWREALLHHLTRQDARHNFSPYFYSLYLAPPGALVRRALASLAFVPQAALLVALAVRFGRDLPFCLFMQTVVFVSFNKVCTAQYFVWYHALLPLVLPSSAALLRAHRPRTAAVVSLWVITLMTWLGCAHQLEFRARQAFLPLWLASLAFFAANVAFVIHTIRMHHATPLFRAGRLARQACLYESITKANGAPGDDDDVDGGSVGGLLRHGLHSLVGADGAQYKRATS